MRPAHVDLAKSTSVAMVALNLFALPKLGIVQYITISDRFLQSA
jgi:hypothetical protein